ncbi:MAG: ParB N-terminal domain-containing protein [Streptosporangiaceae bacterium]|nr:ParB N-terminal domain-containing protein [Streptosporangiaceae bacterium]MBV9857606.1 ParB N-terminal domain-containing protein [Streptosporangiaceae bacterium]
MTTLNIELPRQVIDVDRDRGNSESASSPDNGFYHSSSDAIAYDSIEMVDQLPVVEVPVSSLESGPFLRGSGTDPAHVRLLADAASSSDLPPILVQKSTSRIIDGMHRLKAGQMRGEKTIRVRFINCTDENAFILAVKSNTLHGLPLSRTDRIFGAKRILAWHPDWSDRAVGAAAGLSAKTIAGLRRLSDSGSQQAGKRLGRDGKRRPVAGTEGRRRAADYIAAQPNASLREIARVADVSLGTAQDVRARLQRGMDPITRGQQSTSTERSPQPPSPADSQQPEKGGGLRDARRTASQPDWPAISAKLMNDPSLKYSEVGRAFIRWMTPHAARSKDWREYIDAIPAHWLKEMCTIAESIREEWRDFAEQLQSRQNATS